MAAVGDGLLLGARYVGVLRSRDKSTGRTLSGSGMIFWLGDEDGKGDILETEISLNAVTLSAAVTAIVGPSNAVTVGTVQSIAGTYTGKHQFQTRREALSIICDAFNAEFRVNGDGTVDVGSAAFLYNTEAPDTIVVRKGAGTDMDLVALGGKYQVDESVFDYSPRVVLLGQTVGTGDAPDEVFATGSANAPSVPYLNLRGNVVKITRAISESGTTSGSVAARAQLQLNRFNRVARSLKVTAEEYETEGNFVVGDDVYVYDPDTGIVNASYEVPFRGEVLHPDVVRASGITWPVVRGMTVAFRTQAGVWLDLTPFVTYETGGNELTVGDLPKSLTKPGDNPVQVRLDAVRADASIPNPPTGLTLTTSSTLNAQGVTGAVIHASWSAPTLNTDGSVIQDLSHYVVEYRWTARAPLWQQANATSLTEVDLIVTPGLPYQVRVTAYDLGGKASAPTATSAITSAADAIAPNPPADPVVTSYLGQLRIEYAGTDSTGNPMASDTNRIDVHVSASSGFTPTTATRVDSVTPFAKGISYATAPYGSTRYVKLIAVDHSGNPSAASGQVSGATVQVAQGDVASVNVGSLVAGTMTADVITSGRFTTALTGARREMNSVGFQAYDASSNLIINLDGTNNLLTGIFKTALTGRRIELGAAGTSGSARFIAPDGTVAEVKGFTSSLGAAGEEAIQLSVPIASTYGAWNAVQATAGEEVFISSALVQFSFGGNGATTKAFTVTEAQTRGTTSTTWAKIVRFQITNTQSVLCRGDGYIGFMLEDITGAWFYRHPTRTFAIYDRDNSNANLGHRFTLTDTDVWFRWTADAARVLIRPRGFPGGSARVQIINEYNFGITLRHVSNSDGSGGRLDVLDAPESGYAPIWASAFTPSSSAVHKTNIRPIDAGASNRIAALRPSRFQRKRPRPDDPDNPNTDAGGTFQEVEETGFIAEEMPPELRVEGGDLGPGYDLVGVVATNVAATQEILARLAKLERGAG